MKSPRSFPCPAHGSTRSARGGGPPDRRLGGAVSFWGTRSGRKPCLLQITDALCYAQRLFYFFLSGINFPKQTLAGAEMKIVMRRCPPIQHNPHQLPLCWLFFKYPQALLIVTNGLFHMVWPGRARLRTKWGPGELLFWACS